MSYMDHMWINSENLSERLEMLVFCLQESLASENIPCELPEDFNYLKFDSNNSKHYELVKEYHEALYEKLGRLIDDMGGEFLTDSCKLPNPQDLKSSDGEEL
ncbi:MAG: hypothetical protein FWH29_01440 [Methanobrevibacter sp.]|nr:hypothetical protein [Methanobrevibacter sp.]